MDAWHIILAAYVGLLDQYMYYPADWSFEKCWRESYDYVGMDADEAADWLAQIASGEMVLGLNLHAPRKDNRPPGVALFAA